MSLPDAWVEKIFAKLSLVYGHAFLSRWDGLDMTTVKADWAHELSGFQQHPRAIAWALENLPERAPNVLEFKYLARRAPPEQLPRLDAPKADPARVAAELEKLTPLREAAPAVDRLAWAREIVERASSRNPPTPTVLRMAKDALAANGEQA